MRKPRSKKEDTVSGKEEDPKLRPEEISSTEGGAYITGDVYTGGGDFIGRDQITITEERAYDVNGLPNPYLGLRSFTYDDRSAYGGREALIQETVAKITGPGSRQILTFVTGASGSGKSSFAQAGLIPALESHYQARQRTVRRGVFRPSSKPLAMLGDALEQLGIPGPQDTSLDRMTSLEFEEHIAAHTAGDQVNLLVIDQFEELFTVSEKAERDRLIQLLSNLPDFDSIRTHFIATLRSDYLKDLFDIKDLWDQARQGIELRGMRPQELKDAIQRPLLAAGLRDERYKHKRFEPGLVERLAEDAALDITYLPLLQVTLLELWNQGSLRLEAYSDLTAATRDRAERVYNYADFDSTQAVDVRSESDKEILIEIFLDLVAVSLDDDPRRDARLAREREALEKASPQRKNLIDDLVRARLLSTRVEKIGESLSEEVEIIHDTLIQNWDRLNKAVVDERQRLKKRSRFELNFRDWISQNSADNYLLSGIHLAEARQLEEAGDIALQDDAAKKLLAASIRQQRSRTRRNIYQRGLLAGSIGGGVGFGLAVMVFTIKQTTQEALLWLIFGLIFAVLGFLTVGLISSLGIAFSLTLQESSPRRARLLLSSAGGALGYTLAVVFSSLAGRTQGASNLLFLLLEGVLWGAVSGAAVFLGLTLRKPRWMLLASAGLAGGAVFALTENIAHAFLRGGPENLPSLWQYFIAGAVVPVCLLLALMLAKLPEADNP